MKMTVGTAPLLVDTSDTYPDLGSSGQVVLVQNLGPGTVSVDFAEDPSEGIELNVGASFEFQRASTQSLYVVSSQAATDVRVVAVS